MPLLAILGLMLLALLGRFLPYFVPELGNFTPVAAVALFAGCYLRDRKLALWVPLAAMLLSDAIIGFHSLLPVVYACIALTVLLGAHMQQKATAASVLTRSLLASLLFFVVTNVAVWLEGSLYPMTSAGLRDCFIMALPFWRNELAGTLFYGAALFGSYALLKARFPKMVTA